MQNWISRLFKKREDNLIPEWRTENSIYRHIFSNLDENGILPAVALDLPDDDAQAGDTIYAPGLEDHLFSGGDPSKETLLKITKLNNYILHIAETGNEESAYAFYRLIIEKRNIMDLIKEYAKALSLLPLTKHDFLFPFVQDLTTRTQHRNAVKFGIMMMGILNYTEALSVVKTLALHDEFTGLAIIAIHILSENPENDVWELAPKLQGWGKINILKTIAKPDLSKTQKEWLILHGYRNEVHNAYLAYTCAMHGELHIILQQDKINKKFFFAASEILESLLTESSPTQDIHDYPFAFQVVHDYLRHATGLAENSFHFNVLQSIKSYLLLIQDDIKAQHEKGWTKGNTGHSLQKVESLLHNKKWEERVLLDLQSDDKTLYWNAKEAAAKLSLDATDSIWSWLERNPLEFSAWYDVIQQTGSQEAERIIAYAEQHLPFDQMAGPLRDANAYQGKYRMYRSHEFVTRFLADHPKKGEKILLHAMHSPVTYNRDAAIFVLEKWGKENWSQAVQREISNLQKLEPNVKLKERMNKLM